MDDLLSNGFHEKIMISQQTFVLMKTSLRRLLSSSSEDAFKTSLRCLDQDEYIRLTHTSSEDVFKTSWSRPIYSSWLSIFKSSSRHFQEVFKASSRLLAKTSSRHLQDVFKHFENAFKTSSKRFQGILTKTNIFALLIRLQKTSSRRLDQDQYIRLDHISSRHLQDVFKRSSRRLQDLLQKRLQDIFKTSLRRFQDVFKTFSRRFQDVLQNVLKTSSRCLQDIFKTRLKRLQDVFKTFWKRLQDILQRFLHEGFKTDDQLFLLNCSVLVFKTFLRPTAKTVI